MAPLALALLLLLPFLAVPLVASLGMAGRRAVAGAAGAVMGAGVLLLAWFAPAVLAGETLVIARPWLSEWGLDLSLRLDGLSFLFALLIYGIGLLIVLYAFYYLPATDRLARFLATLLAFAAGMLGVVLAENVLLMLLFWEVTSLTSFLLIAYKSQYHDSRIAARMALAVTGGGGLALLAGLLILGDMAGSYQLSAILAAGDSIRADPRYPLMLCLLLLGPFTKSAQFPFHFWLPNAMAAPTPVSAYLHSATMVKAGVFLLARLYPAISGTELWFGLVVTTGAVTFVMGAYLALLKHDFKGLLAYSTISHLGLITLMFGLDTATSAVAAVFHIINHAVFKASLFMAAGIIDIETGSRDMRKINGLAKYMPITAALGIVAAAGMAGVPFLNGFLSKEMFFAETIAHPAFEGVGALILPAVGVVGGLLSVAYSARFVHDVFFNGEPVDLPKTPKEPPRFMRLPVEVLVMLVLAVGILPQLIVGDLLKTASAAVLQTDLPPIKLAIWHGFNLPLVMSIVALGGGLFYYWSRERVMTLHERLALEVSSPVAFERLYAWLCGAAARVLGLLDRERARQYVALLLVASLGLGAWAWLVGAAGLRGLAGPLAQTPPDGPALIAFAALAVGTLGVAVLHQQRLIAIIFLSVAGLVVALAFVRFAAPDLALTQLSVEVAAIMLLLLALRYLPQRSVRADGESPPWRDFWLAAGAGGGAAGLSYAMLTRPFETISAYHLAEAKPLGGGTNAVNVILVDFRGFDTLSEIAVLAMAALGAQALLAGLRLAPQVPDADSEADRWPVMLRQMMQPMLPLALAVSVYIFLRGHNLPGGGFIGGLIAAVAIVLQYLSAGIAFAEKHVRADFVRMLGWGLAIAALTGVASMVLGLPFLTSGFTYVYPPLLEPVELASALVFDLGIYLVVIASIVLVLTELGQMSSREAPRLQPTPAGDEADRARAARRRSEEPALVPGAAG
jgi:multicomponent K+:H+ antiporter subunit A